MLLPDMKLDVAWEEQMKALGEEHGFRDIVHTLAHVCAEKTRPASASAYDREIASRWGEALVLLTRIQPKLRLPF